jgi:Protein of Unknown function (DUF2784)
MWYGAAADLVMVVHLLFTGFSLFIGFVVGGALAAWLWPRIIWAHLRRWCMGPWSSSPASHARSRCWKTTCATTPGKPGTAGGSSRTTWSGWPYPPGLTRGTQIRLGVLVLLAAITDTGAFCAGKCPAVTGSPEVVQASAHNDRSGPAYARPAECCQTRA